ncbi:orotidine-5'-phosphate decarboxylase [Lentibacillus amyloliquefaciens]|uniref:Orotidine 5'-phosphate decarboxylase n=1 Tax=Lentibacillus amyloliquefaciens TaxID=1472767 RepID=A0A0U3W2L9_9BACI|nr:orotidine-5'-phosphate decarboxylase [Lentibacillus amyloliquefaciens]ALX47408.1 orotidine 5'-phosphate decarboxylase [Lentibacillus amyloliquefaciens]
MRGKIFLALDFPVWEEAKNFIEQNDLQGVPVKVGMELFYREGSRLIDSLKQNHHEIFLDLKLHDIPTTVKRTMKNLAALGVDMVNVHALGGSDMIRQAKQGLTAGSSAGHIPKLIAVTILTSMNNHVMNDELGISGHLQDSTVHLSKLAFQSGADGVVCSVYEAGKIKNVCGPSFLTVTPGIRLSESANNDQKRIATPASARENRADILIVGRTVTDAKNPKAAYEKVRKEWLYGEKL